jgi:hypothetical protein
LFGDLIERETQELLDLRNMVSVEVMTANFKTVRGRTVVAALLDELAFWPTDEESANPDSEIIGALRSAMTTIPGAMMLKARAHTQRRVCSTRTFNRIDRARGKSDTGPLTRGQSEHNDPNGIDFPERSSRSGVRRKPQPTGQQYHGRKYASVFARG